MIGLRLLNGHKSAILKIAYQIAVRCAAEYPFANVRLILHVQRINIGAFVVSAQMQTLDLSEMNQIDRAEDHVLIPIQIKGKDIAAQLFAPDYLGISVAPLDVLNHGIVCIFLEGHTAIGRIRHTLGMGLAGGKCRVAACSGIEEQDGIFVSRFQTADVVFVHNATARKHRAEAVGLERRIQLVPIDEILGNGVSPGHIAPVAVCRIMLEEHMILVTIIHQAVGIVDPTDFSGKMHHWTKFFVIIAHRRNGIHKGEVHINLRRSSEPDRFPSEMG